MQTANPKFCVPELWGGIECSLNRVGNLFMDQLVYAGHYDRGVSDIARFASLGIKAMRYPVLWERHQIRHDAEIDWSWTDAQLNALREHGITPMVELMHHGSGPPHTNLLHPSFARGLAAFARKVARRYPWLQYYTPVNEPLTTARFSGLYGYWYPHCKDDKSFLQILVSQLHGTVLAMKVIREVNANAKLIQTEDFTKIYSTELLHYQASFENERRWLTFDLLCGRVRPGHRLWTFFLKNGIKAEQLFFFCENPCPPDIIGADYYMISERYLDENVSRYPEHYHGGNRIHTYADVPAVHVNHRQPSGLKIVVEECWARYHTPLAITEIFLDANSHDQIRWLKQVWNTSRLLLQSGIPIMAVTAWSLLGSFGWRNLLRQPFGDYEPGAFSLKNNFPERTELADFICSLACNPYAYHAALQIKPWWQSKERFKWEVELTPSPY